MSILIPFFLIFIAGLIFTGLSSRLHLPYVTALIVAGMIFGPSGIGVVDFNVGIDFFASIGLIFLMFLAGSKINFKSLAEDTREIGIISLVNSTVPFLVGFSIGFIASGDIRTSLLLGIIFISSSVAIVIPVLEYTKLINSRLGKVILASTVLQDIASLFLLGLVLQTGEGVGLLQTIVLLVLIIIMIFIGRNYIQDLEKWFVEFVGKDDLFESELRFVLVILFSAVITFELIGFNAIVAAFIVGILLSEVINEGKLEQKFRTLSYGMFIPVFFFVIGMQTDIRVLANPSALLLIVVIVVGLVSSKFISGFLAARFTGFSTDQSALLGSATVPQLSTTLAVTFAAADAQLLSPEYVTALVTLTLATSLLAPFALNTLSARISNRTVNTKEIPGEPVIIEPK